MTTQAPPEPATGSATGSPSAQRRRKGPSAFVHSYGWAILFVVALLVAWEVIVRAADVPEYLIPAPSNIAVAMKSDWVYLGPAMWVTLREIAIGFVIAAVLGVGLALVLHLFGPLRRAVYPLLIGSQTLPIVLLAPILVIWLGYGIMP